MDVGTGLALLGPAHIAAKILGPTADYVGEGLRAWAETRVRNVQAIFTRAGQILGERVDHPGTVPPKVLHRVLTDGSYASDPLEREYFAGVLASSRNDAGGDDRGVSMLALLGRLSSHQVQAHFMLYSVARGLYLGRDLRFVASDKEMLTAIPQDSVESSLGWTFETATEGTSMWDHTFFGLAREALIDHRSLAYGNVDQLREYTRVPVDFDEDLLLFHPSTLGAELFLWAHGLGHMGRHALIESDVRLESPALLELPAGAFQVGED